MPDRNKALGLKSHSGIQDLRVKSCQVNSFKLKSEQVEFIISDSFVIFLKLAVVCAAEIYTNTNHLVSIEGYF